MTTHGRYLGVLRLSRDKDTSTSTRRQRENIERYVDAPHFSGSLVGWAEDTDVSGGLSPFKRPQLGRRLTQWVDEFDGIVATKVWQDLVPWARYSAVIDFGDFTCTATAVALRPPDDGNRLVTYYRCGPDDVLRTSGSLAPS